MTYFCQLGSISGDEGILYAASGVLLMRQPPTAVRIHWLCNYYYLFTLFQKPSVSSHIYIFVYGYCWENNFSTNRMGDKC